VPLGIAELLEGSGHALDADLARHQGVDGELALREVAQRLRELVGRVADHELEGELLPDAHARMDAIGLGATVEYLEQVGMDRAEAYERDLLAYATEAVSSIPGVRLIGTAREKAGVVSFVIDGVHPHDIGTVIDREGVAVRAGHHCAQPVMDRFGVGATTRASFAFYNTKDYTQ